MTETPPIPTGRMIAFLVFAGWIVVSPGFPMLLGLGQPWIREWRMYSGVGFGTCVADYVVVDGDDETVVDRFEVLHGKPWYRVRDGERRLNRKDIKGTGKEICDTLYADDVRVDAWCARRGKGWTQVMAREDNLCFYVDIDR